MSDDFPSEPLPFAMSEYEDRLKAVRLNMAQRNLDVLLVTGPENMFYLTGYRTTGYYVFQALVVPQNEDLHFVVRQIEFSNVLGRSWTKKGTSVPDTENILSATADALARIAGTCRVRIGFEDRGYFLPSALVDELRARLPNAAFVSSDMAIEACRLRKSPQEIAHQNRPKVHRARDH
jgi:Xaa-Pro dipeptidase